jgi:RNA-directed DNA polymerase
MEAVVERENMKAAYAQVMRNHGAAGIDGMPVEGLKAYLNEHWPTIKEQLLNKSYMPKLVRKVEIPKPDGNHPLSVFLILESTGMRSQLEHGVSQDS